MDLGTFMHHKKAKFSFMHVTLHVIKTTSIDKRDNKCNKNRDFLDIPALEVSELWDDYDFFP